MLISPSPVVISDFLERLSSVFPFHFSVSPFRSFASACYVRDHLLKVEGNTQTRYLSQDKTRIPLMNQCYTLNRRLNLLPQRVDLAFHSASFSFRVTSHDRVAYMNTQTSFRKHLRQIKPREFNQSSHSKLCCGAQKSP